MAVDNNETTYWESNYCSNCCNYLTMDFTSSKPVGWFYIRTGGEFIPFVDVSGSNDNNTWTPIFSHPKGNWRGLVYPQPTDVSFRYIRAGGCSNSTGGKIQLIELHVFDHWGKWGPPTSNDFINHNTYATLLGVNGIWQWGGSANSLTNYTSFTSNGRNYHDPTWDLDNPNQILNFSHWPTGQGAQGTWLNWDDEYSQWKNGKDGKPGFKQVIASIRYENAGAFLYSNWNNPFQDAFNYAKEFCRHFGNTTGNGYIQCVECGNEPWTFPSDFYREILAGFAAGCRSGDISMKVLPGAFQADTRDLDPTSGGNYIGTHVNASTLGNIDVLNIHAYSYYDAPSSIGVTMATYPEDLRSSFQAIRNMIRWRNINTPGKSVYLTEWGWDGESIWDTPKCMSDSYHDVCVSSNAKALYAIRGLIKAAREGVDRATWFYYANDPYYAPLYARSGLLSTTYQAEPAYTTLKDFISNFGDLIHLGVIKEDFNASNPGFAYAMGSPNGTIRYIAMWLPIDADDNSTTTLVMPRSNWSVDTSATWMRLSGSGKVVINPSDAMTSDSGTYRFKISSNPLFVAVKSSNGSSSNGSSSSDQVMESDAAWPLPCLILTIACLFAI
eukprot:TRINITY_DN5221_c0_g1_i1.p1 TRINITY_DN5221_c0_g1~~TRINITY_DN5221_c0_g1_i1.p1  ORF type:complete len:662 (+),score=138.41 TRINITY_DN5221_c0_g1_i1:156-1988(+)